MRSADGVAGGHGNGRDFPGANRINLNGNGPIITGQSPLSFSAWALTDPGSAAAYVIARFNGNPATSSYAFGVNPVVALFHDGFTQHTMTGVQTFPVGGVKLHHWCVTKDLTTARGYVDGKLDCSLSTSISLANAGTPCLGDVALAAPYNGVIRHAAIWDAALTPWEVMQLAQGVAPWDVQGSKLRVWTPLTGWEGGTGDAKDLSVFNSTATPVGGTTYTLRPATGNQPLDIQGTFLSQIPPPDFLGYALSPPRSVQSA